MATPDVTVIGAGVIGLSIAYTCARRGAYVRVIEKRAVAAGASGGIVGALAPHTPENWNPKKQFQLDSLLMAQDFWSGVEETSGIATGYARTGRLQAINGAKALELAKARVKTAGLFWADKAQWRVTDESIHSLTPLSDTNHYIFDTLAARIHPRKATESLAAAIRKTGSEIVFGNANPEGVTVWATGYEGLSQIPPNQTRPMGNGVKGQALTIAWDEPKHPQVFADGVHFVPQSDGTLAIGSTSEREFENPTATDSQLEELWQRARQLVPAIRGARVLSRWAGVRPRSRSRAPILGSLPERQNEFIANGGFKIGFGMAPKIADVMADLVLDGLDRIPNGFRPEDSL